MALLLRAVDSRGLIMSMEPIYYNLVLASGKMILQKVVLIKQCLSNSICSSRNAVCLLMQR